MMLCAGDVLGCDALLELAAAHAIWPEAGFIHGDDVRFDAVHGRDAPFYKPDFSPELLLNMDYIGRPWCATAATLKRAPGPTSPASPHCPPYAAALLLTDPANGVTVRHINKVLASIAPDVPEACITAVRREFAAPRHRRRGGGRPRSRPVARQPPRDRTRPGLRHHPDRGPRRPDPQGDRLAARHDARPARSKSSCSTTCRRAKNA